MRILSSCITPFGRSLSPRKLILKVLFPPSDWGEQIAANDTKDCSQKLPDGHDDGNPRQNELDELIRLVQVVLAGNVVLYSFLVIRVSLRGKM